MAIKMLTDEETAFFCEQLAMLMEAGIPLADGMAVFKKKILWIAGISIIRAKSDQIFFARNNP